jgi:uncharacterized protein
MPIPVEISGQKYISLCTFRKNGVAVRTPVWFAERDGQLYVMTRNDSGKYKRIRNNSQVKVAASTMRGRLTGPEFWARARILPREQWQSAKEAMNRKYWTTRLPIWSRRNEYIAIEFAS